MTQIIRLSKNMEGNFSGKPIVTPVGIKPIFSFNANRTKFTGGTGLPLPSDYGNGTWYSELQYLTDETDPTKIINKMDSNDGGNYLQLDHCSYTTPLTDSPILENIKTLIGIKFRLDSTFYGGSISRRRLMSLRYYDGNATFYLILSSMGDGTQLGIQSANSPASTKFEQVVDGLDLVDNIVSMVLLYDGENSKLCFNGSTMLPIKDAKNQHVAPCSMRAINLNGTNDIPSHNRMNLHKFEVYTANEFSEQDIKNLWNYLDN